MWSVRPTLIILSGLIAILTFQPAFAGDATSAPPPATATRPAPDRPGQTSLPNNAPAATRTQPTESTNQPPTVKQMNDEAKKKVEVEGK